MTTVQEKMQTLQNILKRHVPRLVDLLFVKSALESAMRYINDVEDSSDEKRRIMEMLQFAMAKVEQWESRVMYDMASQILNELGTGETATQGE